MSRGEGCAAALQEPPPHPVPPPSASRPPPHLTVAPRLLVSVSPARACPELEQGGRGARSHDKFMFWLLLCWPHAESPVLPIVMLLPWELAEAQPGFWSSGSPQNHAVPPSPGPSLLRGCPESCAWPLCPHLPAPALLLQVQPGATSSRKSTRNMSTLHGKGVPLVAPRGWGRDLAPRLWIPNLHLSKPKTLGFPLALPHFSSLGRGSFHPQGLGLRGLSDRSSGEASEKGDL